MKKVLSLTSSLFVLTILLSSCSSSSSIEEQTKLIEYEHCLDTELQKWLLQGENDRWSGSTLKWLDDSWAKDKKILTDFFLEDCKKYRP